MFIATINCHIYNNITKTVGHRYTEGHSFKTLRFFQVIRLCSHRFTFMLMTWKISSIFSTVTARISGKPDTWSELESLVPCSSSALALNSCNFHAFSIYPQLFEQQKSCTTCTFGSDILRIVIWYRGDARWYIPTDAKWLGLLYNNATLRSFFIETCEKQIKIINYPRSHPFVKWIFGLLR